MMANNRIVRVDNNKVVSLFSVAANIPKNEDEGDAQLLERLLKHDHAAFAILVRRHSMRFYRVAYRFLLSRSEAEDVVQNAFLKLWEKPNLWQADKKTAFTTWFYRIIINQCLDYARRKKPLPLINESWIVDERLTPEAGMQQNQQQYLLEKHIAALPERQRTALNLCFYEGFSNIEAASVMGLQLKALQSLLMRAKASLKKDLKLITEGNGYGE